MRGNAVLEEAKWYARQGIFVNAVQPNSKALLSTGDVLASATRDAQRIEQLFAAHPTRNVGVVPGPESDLLVLDPDVKNGAKGLLALEVMQRKCGVLPRTLHERTPSGGEHFLYHLDGAEVKNGKLVIDGTEGLEVFGGHHNVVVSPSVINGVAYTFIGGRREIAPLPPIFIDFIQSHYVKGDKTGEPKVGRNNGMYREACRLRHHNEPEAEAWNKLLALNDTLCTPPLGESELKKLFRSAWNQPPGYFLTDLGNCERFRDQHGQDLRFVYESKRWLHWDGMRWVADEAKRTEELMTETVRRMHLDAVGMPQNDETQRAARKQALQWSNTSERKERIQGALALVPNPANIIKQTALDADPWLFATRNAIVDLHHGHDVKPDRSQLITKVANVDYDPAATCQQFEKFLAQVQPSLEVRNFLQRYFGYALTGDTREQCLVICWGTGSNGKSTLLDLMLMLAGDYGTQAATSTWLKRDGIPNDVAALTGRRLVISTEFDEGAHVALSLLKAATGQETLAARFLYGEFFNFRPQFKIAFGTNHKLIIDGGSLATRRRIRLVEFNVTIAEGERDKRLPDKLRAELPGILNWAIAGCLQWQRDGLGFPDEIRKATGDYARDNDQIGSFVADCCETGDDHQAPTTALYRHYKPWCDTNGTRPRSYADFRQALADHGYTPLRTRRERVTTGLRLAPKTPETPSEY